MGATTMVRTGTASPVGWIFSGLSAGTIDAQGRAVFLASSSAVFVRNGALILQQLGPGTALGDGHALIGAGPPTIDGNDCVLARGLVDDGRQVVVRTCGGTLDVLVATGQAIVPGTTLQSIDPALFVIGAETVVFAGILSDGTGVLVRRDAGGLVVVAQSGQASPTGGTFTSFRLAGVSASGRVGFHASVSQGPDGFFAATESTVAAVVLVGQGSPSGGAFSSLGGASVSPSDRWVFRASLSNGSSGVFSADASTPSPSITTIALEGNPAPIAGATFRGFSSSSTPAINPAGTVAFRALLQGVDAGAAVFVAAPDGTTTTIATTRQETPVGLLTNLRDPAIADDGSVVLPTTIAGSGPGLVTARGGTLVQLAQFGATTNADVLDTRFRFSSPAVRATAEGAAFLGEREGVFRRSSVGLIEAIAYTGERSAVDGFFAAFGTPVVDGRGRIVFGATVHQGSVKEAVFTYGDNGLQVLAQPGQRAAGGRYRDFFPSTVDDAGRPGPGATGVALTAELEGVDADQGLFVFNGRHGRVLALSGQQIRGGRLAAFGTPALGTRTQVAFVAEIGRKTRHTAMVMKSGGLRVVASNGDQSRTRVAGQFTDFDRPAISTVGALFRATLSGQVQEGVFLAHGRTLVAVAAAADVTTAGDRLRSFGDPIVSGTGVYFLARLASSDSRSGLYRAIVDHVPAQGEAPPAVAPFLRPGDAGPSDIGGAVVRIDQPGVGPDGSINAVVELAGGSAAQALVWLPADANAAQ